MSLYDLVRFRKRSLVLRIRELSFSDLVNVAVLFVSIAALVVAIIAAYIAVVAMKHADEGGDLMLGELKKEVTQLDESRKLIDTSSTTLGGLLAQTQAEVKLSQAQSRLTGQQIALASEQVKTLQGEFGKKPKVLMTIRCVGWLDPNEPPKPWLPKPEPPVFTFSPDDAGLGRSDFTFDVYKSEENIPCYLSLRNEGDRDAEISSFEGQISGITGPSQPFLPERDPMYHLNPVPRFTSVEVALPGATYSPVDGRAFAPYAATVDQARYGNNPLEIPFSSHFTYGVDSFNLVLIVRGRNFDQKSASISFALKRHGVL